MWPWRRRACPGSRWPILEGAGRTLLLVKVQRLTSVPGRKTDVRDAEWLAALLRPGLLSPSFIPPTPIRARREVTRYPKTLVEEPTAEATRPHKVLESATLKRAVGARLSWAP